MGQSRIGSAAGLIVLARERAGKTELLPSRQTTLGGGDKLLVQGRLDRFREFQRWSELVIEREAPVLQGLMAGQVELLEVTVTEDSALVSELLHHADFRRGYNANILAIRRGDLVRRVNLAYVPIRAGDVLLLQARVETATEIRRSPDFTDIRTVSEEDLSEKYRLQERVFVVRIPKESQLAGDTLVRSRLADGVRLQATRAFSGGRTSNHAGPGPVPKARRHPAYPRSA